MVATSGYKINRIGYDPGDIEVSKLHRRHAPFPRRAIDEKSFALIIDSQKAALVQFGIRQRGVPLGQPRICKA
jgi:hypothetical protein